MVWKGSVSPFSRTRRSSAPRGAPAGQFTSGGDCGNAAAGFSDASPEGVCAEAIASTSGNQNNRRRIGYRVSLKTYLTKYERPAFPPRAYVLPVRRSARG